MRVFSRKSKIDGEPPKPPTKAEILEDLDTFSLDHINLNKTHRRLGEESTLGAFSTSDASLGATELSKIDKRDDKESNSERQLDEWWDTFEKFLCDIDKLEVHQKHFQAKKTNLAKLDETIGLMADDIHTRITDSLQKATAEISDSEQDLK